MSRCTACDKILSSGELLNTDKNTMDLCRVCINHVKNDDSFESDEDYVLEYIENNCLTKHYNSDILLV